MKNIKNQIIYEKKDFSGKRNNQQFKREENKKYACLDYVFPDDIFHPSSKANDD